MSFGDLHLLRHEERLKILLMEHPEFIAFVTKKREKYILARPPTYMLDSMIILSVVAQTSICNWL